jgi:hypothetical protein
MSIGNAYRRDTTPSEQAQMQPTPPKLNLKYRFEWFWECNAGWRRKRQPSYLLDMRYDGISIMRVRDEIIIFFFFFFSSYKVLRKGRSYSKLIPSPFQQFIFILIYLKKIDLVYISSPYICVMRRCPILPGGGKETCSILPLRFRQMQVHIVSESRKL